MCKWVRETVPSTRQKKTATNQSRQITEWNWNNWWWIDVGANERRAQNWTVNYLLNFSSVIFGEKCEWSSANRDTCMCAQTNAFRTSFVVWVVHVSVLRGFSWHSSSIRYCFRRFFFLSISIKRKCSRVHCLVYSSLSEFGGFTCDATYICRQIQNKFDEIHAWKTKLARKESTSSILFFCCVCYLIGHSVEQTSERTQRMNQRTNEQTICISPLRNGAHSEFHLYVHTFINHVQLNDILIEIQET